jgi:hypothetical protein
VLAFILMLGCNSAPSKTVNPGSGSPQKSVGTAKRSTDPDIDLNCVVDHIQNPPESFHYAFKAESDNPWQEEADVTPQQIDGSFSNSTLSKPQQFHGTPREVSSNLMAIGRMASLFATVRNSSAVVNEGAQNGVNSYDTIKYSIDTARGTATEQVLYKSILGPQGFEKGAVWVTSQGCPVRIVLDEELHSEDGSVAGKTHYEEAMIKK